MQVPLEITYRNVEKTEEVDALIRNKAAKLDEICDYLISCRVVIEKIQRHQSSGQPYRVRLDIKLPPGHEIVVNRDPSRANLHLDLGAEVRWAFDTAARQLKELMEKQRRDVKKHPFQEAQGIVDRVFRMEGTGFIRTTDGRQIFFHRNALINDSFDTIKEGDGVRYVEVMGEKGPQASTVQVVESPPSY
ncbi:MAG: cold shock domain-containing protein [Chitinispirillaceae bacterium]